MKIRFYILALIVIVLILAGLTDGLSQGTDKIWFVRPDTTYISFDGKTSDSSLIRGLQVGQLVEWLLRSNDYGSTDGIKIHSMTPDGDSTLAGVWMLADGKVYLIAGNQSKLIASRLGTNMYGNYILNPATGGTQPFFILKNSSNDSTWLSMSAGGLPQWNRAFNLPSQFPASPATGDFGRSGDILYFRSSIGTFGINFGSTPIVGMGLRYQGGGIWSPGYPDTSGSAGGGGGSGRWDSLEAPQADLALNMGLFKTTFTYGDFIGDAFTVQDNAGSTGDYLWAVKVHDDASTRKVVLFLGAHGNGVEVLNNGTIQRVGNGHVSADQWLGLDTVRRANLPVKVAFEDEANAFITGQTIAGATTTAPLTVVRTGTDVGNALSTTNSGDGNSNALSATATGTGRGGYVSAVSGVGLTVNSASGIPFRVQYAGTTVIDATSAALTPNVSGAYDVGTFSKHVGDLFTDSLFVGTIDSTVMWRGDGKLVKFYNGAFTFHGDTVLIPSLGIDSTFDCTWNFIGRSSIIASPGGRCYNNGTAEFTSTTSPMSGAYVSYRIWKRNQQPIP